MAHAPLKTPLCDLLGIEYPVIQAGMGLVASGALAAAVSEVGGLGVIGGTGMTPEQLDREIRFVKGRTSRPFGVDLLLPPELDPVRATAPREGRPRTEPPPDLTAFVDQLRREFDLPEAHSSGQRALAPEHTHDLIDVIFSHDVPVFAFGLGTPAWLVEEGHRRRMRTLSLVGNVKNARRVAALGTDVVVAQGHEASGHTGRIGTLALVPQVVDVVGDVPVVAAALALGAQGV